MQACSRFIPALLFCLLLSAPLCAASWQSVDRQTALADAAAVNRDHYPNADVVEVSMDKWVRYAPDGTYEEYYESYAKALTEKGRRDLTTITSSFTIPYNTTEFLLAEVIRADGSTQTVDLAANTRVMTEESQMEQNIFNPNSRLLRLSVPEFQVGDTIHFVMHDVFAKTRVPDTFSDYVIFESTNPIKYSRYTVVAPRKLPLRRVTLKGEVPDTVAHQESRQDDTITYTWEARDVPRAFEEPDMPPLYTQSQRLLVSTIADWREISRWYWNLNVPHLENVTPEMKQLADELTAGLTDEMDKIRAIFTWVSQDIRYLGITVETEAPGYEPHPVCMTFDRRAGVCRDKAALLVSLLRLAGFDAFPVLIMNGPKKDTEVPQPYFNHAISAVRLNDGSYQLMDSTDENTREIFPAYLGNQSYLVATPEGETLLTSPVPPAETNLMRIASTGALDADGTLHARSELVFTGINDNAYRGYFARLTPKERRDFFERIIKRTAPGATLEGLNLQPADMLDTATPLTARMDFVVPDYAIGTTPAMVPVLSLGRHVGMANFLLGTMGLEQRRYPLVTDFACGVEETVDLDLGPRAAQAPTLPSIDPVDNEGVLWQRDLSFKNGHLLSTTRFALRLPEYDSQAYLALQADRKRIEKNERRMPVFTTPTTRERWYTGRPDALMLEDDLNVTLADSHSWRETRTVRLQVLSYAGIKRYGDLRIPFNPAWEEIRVPESAVRAPDGTVTTVAAQEMNLMDAPWSGTSPRYPAGKVLVMSFPGLTEGSIISYTLERTCHNRPFFSLNTAAILHDRENRQAGTYHLRPAPFTGGALRLDLPMEERNITLDLPARTHLRLERPGLDGMDYRRRKADGRVTHTFTASHVQPSPNEPYAAPWFSFNPVVLASTGTWRRYAEDLSRSLADLAADGQGAAALTRELTAGITDEEARLTLIRDFVASNIRTVDIPPADLPPEAFSSADDTLQAGYAHTADRAILLYAMLDAAGFKPRFILASPLPAVPALEQRLRAYPDPAWFDAMLVRVKTARGPLLLGDTDQYAPLGATPHDKRLGLDLTNGRVRTLAARDTEMQDHITSHVALELSAEGDATMEVRRTYQGMEAARFCKQTSEMSPEQRRRHHRDLLVSLSQSAEAEGDYLTDCSTATPTEAYSARIPDFATREADLLYLELPGLINDIRGAGAASRQTPLYRDEPGRYTVTLTTSLPAGMRPILVPPSGEVRIPGAGTVSTRTGQQDDVLTISQESLLDSCLLPVEDYDVLLEARRLFARQQARMLLLEQP